MIVVDTSVWVDLFVPKSRVRSKLAENVFNLVEKRELTIYAPRLFVVEFISIMARLAGMVPTGVFGRINLLHEPEIFETAKDIALKSHPRAADAYFIATAKLTNSILITNDRIMADNAKKAGVDAYYLIEEFEKIAKKLESP